MGLANLVVARAVVVVLVEDFDFRKDLSFGRSFFYKRE